MIDVEMRREITCCVLGIRASQDVLRARACIPSDSGSNAAQMSKKGSDRLFNTLHSRQEAASEKQQARAATRARNRAGLEWAIRT